MASAGRVWDSAAKWKDASRRRRATELRKRYGETSVPSEGLLSSCSPRTEIVIRTGHGLIHLGYRQSGEAPGYRFVSEKNQSCYGRVDDQE